MGGKLRQKVCGEGGGGGGSVRQAEEDKCIEKSSTEGKEWRGTEGERQIKEVEERMRDAEV